MNLLYFYHSHSFTSLSSQSKIVDFSNIQKKLSKKYILTFTLIMLLNHFDLILVLITYMKYSQLSNFQKEQYANYLESQLQKFSSFMLSQKRENEKYKILEDSIAYQTDSIKQMQSRMHLMELYQKQNHDSFEHLNKKIHKIQDVQDRLRRLQDRERFGCDEQSNRKQHQNKGTIQNISDDEDEINHLANIEENYRECLKKIKKQQVEISNCYEALERIRRTGKIQSIQNQINPQVVERKDLKKLQKKIVKYVNEKIQELSQRRKFRSRSRSSKSRSSKVKELSIIDNYTIKDSKNAISSFRIDGQINNKSEISTINQSKSTNNSKVSQKDRKIKKNQQSKSRSKSKSKNKSKSRSKSQKDQKSKDKSRSKSKNVLNKSISLSDHSILHSSLSHSKSGLSKNQKSKSKDSKLSKKLRKDRSQSKSHSNSHDLCKKRPQFHTTLSKNPTHTKPQVNPLRKRKGARLQRYK